MSMWRGIVGSLLLCGLGAGAVLGQDTATKAVPGPVAPTASLLPGLWDGRSIVPFKALDNPKMVAAGDADFLGDEEYVLGIVVNGEARAYPTRFAWWHHSINDTAKGESPITIAYCSVCNTGFCYDRVLDGRPITLDFYGLYNGVAALCDHATESVFPMVDGKFLTGPLKDKRLTPRALLDTTWGKWKKLHPDTLVMSPENAFQRVYRPKGQAEPRGYERFPMPFFGRTLTRTDDRLPRFEKVLGVTVVEGDKPLWRAYPLKAVQEASGVVADTVGMTAVVVFMEKETQTANAFSPVIDGKTLTFGAYEENGGTVFNDKETGSRWSVEGVAEEGPMKGKSLTPLTNHLSQWYGWVAYFPETSLYGRTDPPHTIPLTGGKDATNGAAPPATNSKEP